MWVSQMQCKLVWRGEGVVEMSPQPAWSKGRLWSHSGEAPCGTRLAQLCTYMHSAHGKAKSSPKACQRKSLVKSAYQSWIKHVTAVLKMSHSWLPTTLQGDTHTYIYTAFKLIFPEHISLLLLHWKKDFSPHAKLQTFHGYISHTHRLEALNVCCRLHSVYWKSASLKLKSPAEREETSMHYSSMLSLIQQREISRAHSMLLHRTNPAQECSV